MVSYNWDSFHNTIDGKPRGATSLHYGVDPTTGEQSWPVPIATQQDVDDAVGMATATELTSASAARAFKSWRQVSLDERRAKLILFGEALAQHNGEMLRLLCKETGKPQAGAALELAQAEAHVKANAKHSLPEDRFEDEEKVITTRCEFDTSRADGRCAAGSCCGDMSLELSNPFEIAAALVTGNTIVVKPSPFTPYTALKMVEIAQEIFPPGVLQAVGGDDNLGPMLTAHPDIAKISFTGSIATGKKVMAACASTLKRVTLELGGNDASIILPDVDVDKVAAEVVMGAFQNSGQVCVATKRIYVHKDIYKPFLEAMVNYTKTLKVGGSYDEGVMLGPIQNSMQFEKVVQYFDDSKKNKHNIAVGVDTVTKGKGFFVTPTIVDNPPSDSRLITEEPFGPIVPVQPWSDEAEVINRANDTNTGLGACVWGKDVERAERIAWQLQAGSVFVNSWEKPVADGHLSGHKESGIGGEWASFGLTSYCNVVCLHRYKNM